MAKDYATITTLVHPGTSFTCLGDPTVYTNITWIDTAITKATLDSDYLDCHKEMRKQEIDTRTAELIEEGFTYDSVIFSLSQNAQLNWSGNKIRKADLTWPLDISSLDGDTYSLAEVDVDEFWDTAESAKETHLSSGRVLKKSIIDAVTEAAVDAVVDNR